MQRVCPTEFPPLAFATAPPQGRFKPSGALPVGADSLAQQNPLSRVRSTAYGGFALDRGFLVVLYWNHRRSNLPRGRAVGTSRHRGFRGGSTPNKRVNISRSVYIFPMLAMNINGSNTALFRIQDFTRFNVCFR